MQSDYPVKYLNANLEADFVPAVFTPVKVGDYFLGTYNRKIEGTILDKLFNSDMDGVWNSKDSRTFAEHWVESLGNKYGFTDSQKEEVLRNFGLAQKTFDTERVKKGFKPFVDAGVSYEAHLDACRSGAFGPSIVAGALKFRDEVLRSGYAFVMNSLSPIELSGIVGHERMGIPAGNCFGTRLFDNKGKILSEPEPNFPPMKRTHADEFKPQHGLTEKSLEISLSDHISDLHMISTVHLHPSVWVTDSNELPSGVRLKFPQGRDYIFPLARKIQQYEVGLIEIALGKNSQLSCGRSLEIRELFRDFQNDANLENRLRQAIANFIDAKIPAMQEGSAVRIQRLLNTVSFKSFSDKVRIFEKILYEELKTYTIEFSLSEERLRNLVNTPSTNQQDP